jgi:hypothetical protein
MTQDEIIELARQAGFYINDKSTITSPFIEDICISPMLKEFAKLVEEKEREACATMSDWILKEWGGTWGDAIRARGQA